MCPESEPSLRMNRQVRQNYGPDFLVIAHKLCGAIF